MSKFPKRIFVQKQIENGEKEFLLAYNNVEDAEDDKVAIYELKEVKTKTTQTILK